MSHVIPHPPVVTQAQWLSDRKKLLAHEKKLTKQRDHVNAERRMLPMVKIEKDYVFDGPGRKQNLAALFDGRRQLIVYHFMFGPEDEKGCSGCTSFVDALGDISALHSHDTSFVCVSRAPLAKLEAYKVHRGWSIPWVSSYGNDFNYDYNVTHDEKIAPIEYNYSDKAALQARRGPSEVKGEDHGLSVFFCLDDDVYHTYSCYARGVEGLTDAYSLLDVTPYGRQQDFEVSPPGWPQKPTY